MKQITIVAAEQPGIVADLSAALGAAGVNIETIDAESVGGSAVVILTVDQYDIALQALARTPYNAVTEDAILVQLEDRPGALAEITRRFKEANINLRSIRFMRRAGGHGFVAIGTDRTPQALDLVRDVLIS